MMRRGWVWLVFLLFPAAQAHGQVEAFWLDTGRVSLLEFRLLEARLDYVMTNPLTFNNVRFFYDSDGVYQEEAGFRASTKGKLVIYITDERKKWDASEQDRLLSDVRLALETAYSFVRLYAPDFEADIACVFFTGDGTRCAWFEEGKYRLDETRFEPAPGKERWIPDGG